MKSPDAIKKGLNCLMQETRDTVLCSFCAYRHEKDCRVSVAKDAAQYIAKMEPLAAMASPERGGRVRTVWLYTVTAEQDGVLCKDATAEEAGAALGYATRHGVARLFQQCAENGSVHGLTVTRRRGVIGKHQSLYRMPLTLYSVVDREGRKLLENACMKDLAAYYGASSKTLYSKFHRAKARGCSDRIAYHGDTIIRQKTERGAKYT